MAKLSKAKKIKKRCILKKEVWNYNPIYNEQDIIEKVIYDWLTVAKKFNGFLIIINDGSSDNSLKILKKIKRPTANSNN